MTFKNYDLSLSKLYGPVDRGLLTANGKRWQRSRRLLTPAFHYDILRPYMKVYASAVEETINLWKRVPEGESVDVFPYMSLLTLDIMLRCTCSFRSNCQQTKYEARNSRARLCHFFSFLFFFTGVTAHTFRQFTSL